MNTNIQGVQILPIKTIADERGTVYKLPLAPFSVLDVYSTTVRQGAIKAWHGYKTKTLMWSVVSGLVRLALYDSRVGSDTQGLAETFYLGEGSAYSIVVPPGVYNGFKGVSDGESIVVVSADEVYSETGMMRMPFNHFEYDWRIKHG